MHAQLSSRASGLMSDQSSSMPVLMFVSSEDCADLRHNLGGSLTVHLSNRLSVIIACASQNIVS